MRKNTIPARAIPFQLHQDDIFGGTPLGVITFELGNRHSIFGLNGFSSPFSKLTVPIPLCYLES
jgi:hypothetical protein